MWSICWPRSLAKNYCPVSLLTVISKVFEKLAKNRLADFQCGFKSSRLIADLLAAVSDTVAWAFYSSGASWVVALDISKTSDRVKHAGRPHKVRFYEDSCRALGLIC